MKGLTPVAAISALLLGGAFASGDAGEKETVHRLRDAFAQYSGAALVFERRDLPPGEYYDVMTVLPLDDQVKAGSICLREVKKLPPGYLKAIGLRAIGIFASCVSRQGDGFRPYDEVLKGYRYYGIWNGKNAVAAAYYTDSQLPLTFHHEIFHHVDATSRGQTDLEKDFTQDDRLRDALSGKAPYRAPQLVPADLAALQRLSGGYGLESVVSEYAAKNVGEDKAETARHLMSTLPDSLVQIATRPQLPGSQRILHVLRKYQEATAEGPGVGWFVDVALGRVKPPQVTRPADGRKGQPPPALAERLRALAAAGEAGNGDPEAYGAEAREALRQAESLVGTPLDKERARRLVSDAAAITYQLLRQRIRPREDESVFTIWGQEDDHGINRTLREDVRGFGRDAQRLKKIATLAPGNSDLLTRSQLQGLRLLARYYVYIASRWEVTPSTRQLFENTRDIFTASLAEDQADLTKTLTGMNFEELAGAITAAGRLHRRQPSRVPRTKAQPADNPYLENVDVTITNPETRAAIRRVQPACVRLGGGSGVNLTPDGCILTAGHVPGKLGAKLTVRFPDGRSYAGTCTAHDHHLDLAIVRVHAADPLPFAPLAREPPQRGTPVVCIGQPSEATPDGEPTGYKPFHVSTGVIRGFLDDPLGDQSLGRTKHDAWTYWGHSGSPLFDRVGRIVALHNSWDSETAMRHAVTYQAIMHFLRKEKVRYSTAE